MGSVFLSDFLCPKASFEKKQSDSFEWLKTAYRHYQKSQDFSEQDYSKLLKRVGVSEEHISQRGYFLPDFHQAVFDGSVFRSDHAEGIGTRQDQYVEICGKIMEKLFCDRALAEHLIHVSCTGYVSPSPLQLLAAQKKPDSIVTHSYHMGCYGAFPALRIASGFLQNPILAANSSVDVVHTELCTLHLNPKDPTLEQMVIQTLFSDGVALYRLSKDISKPSFELLHLTEFLIPDSQQAMAWGIAESGFKMSLSKDVPSLIAANIRQALEKWEGQSGQDIRILLKDAVLAVHPGGPKIIDLVRDSLELSESQIRFSRKVLKEKGNMSSATVPHIWNEILLEREVADGTPVVSMAFGPGLTLSLSLMRVRR